MAFQFMHVEAYGRTLTSGNQKKTKAGGHTVRSIVAEATREPGNTSHIDAPQPPHYLHGKPLEQLESACEAWASTAVDASGKKLRKDALCLLAGVFSAPDGTTPDEWQKIKEDALGWLTKRYGDRLQTVVEHVDESHPHCHFYVIPRPGERFDAIHDGKRAANELPKGTLKGERNQAYKAAMRSFQDEYHEHVGAPNGMTRIGPGRRRLTREAWKLEQMQQEHIAQQLQHADALVAQAGHALEGAKAGVERIRSDALSEIRKMQQKALSDADKAQETARQEGIEQGRTEALEQFGKSSLWAKLTGLLSRKDTEIEALKTEVKTLRKERDKAGKEVSRLGALVKSVKAAGKSVAERFLGLERERDDALTRAEKAERQRDHFKTVVGVLQERDEGHAELVADRDLQRARADAAERKLAQYEAPTVEQGHGYGQPRNIAKKGDDLNLN